MEERKEDGTPRKEELERDSDDAAGVERMPSLNSPENSERLNAPLSSPAPTERRSLRQSTN